MNEDTFQTLNNALIKLDAAHKKARAELVNATIDKARGVIDRFTTKLINLFPDVCGIGINGDYRVIEEYNLEFEYRQNTDQLPDCSPEELYIVFPDQFTEAELQEVKEAAGFLNQETEEDSW